MNIEQAYNIWAEQYDTNINKTRDLEAVACRETLANIAFDNCLEIGCGTGKNTFYLSENCKAVTAIDFSDEMLHLAKNKIKQNNVYFIKANILEDWTFTNTKYDLISFSLVLKHIKDIESIIKKAELLLNKNGFIYIGEFHPYKQYLGSKARFENENGMNVLECYTHHISDFTNAAIKNNLRIIKINEFFDSDNNTIPRIFTLLIQKK